MFPRIRNITRYDADVNPGHSFKGWRVHLVFRGEKNVLYFSDRQYKTPKASLRAAKAALKTLRKKYGLI